ncbi:MAG: phosphatase [Bacteroidota bacterium]|nr:phosphatase [Bacteroidota bacterium]
MEQRAAIIDLGTNTFHLLIFEWSGTRYSILHKLQLPVKLGKGAFADKLITPESYDRGLKALLDFKKLIEQYKISRVEAFGTSALRNASNAEGFVREAEVLLGIEMKIINGKKEAELIYEGVRHAIPFGDDPHLIMDIGGGSVEFIIADKDYIFWKQSYEIGAARLLEKFSPESPMAAELQEAIESYLEDELEMLWVKAEKYQVRVLAGASGSFESLASIDIELYHSTQQAQPFVHYILNFERFEKIHATIMEATREDLEHMPGLPSFRVEMIALSALMIKYVLTRLKIRKVIVSDYALKEGVMFRIMNNQL